MLDRLHEAQHPARDSLAELLSERQQMHLISRQVHDTLWLAASTINEAEKMIRGLMVDGEQLGFNEFLAGRLKLIWTDLDRSRLNSDSLVRYMRGELELTGEPGEEPEAAP